MNTRRVPLTFILFIFCFATAANAQRRMPPLDFDQFRKGLVAAQSPEEKLNRYLEAVLQVFRYSPDSLFTFASEIRNLQGLKPAKQKAFKNFFLAYAWRPLNRDSAIYYGHKAAEQLKTIGARESYLRTEVLLGIEFGRKSDYLNAESAFLNGLNYSQSLDSTYYPVHFFYGNLGVIYSRVGANHLAIKMFEKLLEHADNANDRCNVILSLAGNLMKLKELKKAAKLLLPCLKVNLVPPLQAAVHGRLSEIVNKMGERSRSLALLEKAASISVKYKLPNQQIGHLIRLGNLYLDMNRLQQADSIRILINNTDFHRNQQDHATNKTLFLSRLALAQGQYKNAIAYADSAIQMADTTGSLQRHLGKVYATKAKAYEEMGKLDLAVKNLRLQDELEEVQLERERIRSEAMMKVRYQLRNKNAQLARVNNQLSMLNKKNILLLALVLLVGLTGAFVYTRYRKSRKSEEQLAEEFEKQEITIQALEQKIATQNQKLKERNIPEWVELRPQVKLSLDEIRYIKSDGNYVKIFLSDPERTPLMERLTLKQCEELLPDEITLRIHRTTIVNIRHVSHISSELLYLKDNTPLKISRRYRKGLVNFLG